MEIRLTTEIQGVLVSRHEKKTILRRTLYNPVKVNCWIRKEIEFLLTETINKGGEIKETEKDLENDLTTNGGFK